MKVLVTGVRPAAMGEVVIIGSAEEVSILALAGARSGVQFVTAAARAAAGEGAWR
jgi:hypothetical protein